MDSWDLEWIRGVWNGLMGFGINSWGLEWIHGVRNRVGLTACCDGCALVGDVLDGEVPKDPGGGVLRPLGLR